MKLTSALDIDNKKIVYDGCMVTYTGTIIDLMNPDINTIHVEDIAHGLAFNCRWNGATKTYFSVAEHCVMMCDRMPDHLKATALFHDAEEAYWGDIIKPLKNMLPVEIKQKFRLMRQLIFEKYGIPSIGEYIESVDFELLQWDLENTILSNKHIGLSPYDAEKEWLKRYEFISQIGFVKPPIS